MKPAAWWWLIPCLALVWGAPGTQGGILWQIGKFDESSAEFRQWIDPATGARRFDYRDRLSDRVFVIGSSEPAEDWPAFQPGSANGDAGFREHPAAVEFDLASVPTGTLRLRVALLSYSARLPILQVELNGRRGWFHQQPKLTYSAGDPAVFFQPHYSSSVMDCELRADWFRPGTNRLVLTAVDVPGDREDVRPSGFPWPGCSGLVYDAVSLEQWEDGVPRGSGILEARVEPTIFFRNRNGKLIEEVDVHLPIDESRPEALVALEMASEKVVAEWAPTRDFGEERLTLEVPAWEGSRDAVLRVTTAAGERTINLNLTAARRWQLWVVPHEHLDVGYTDEPAKVAELHSRVIDDAIGLAGRHPGFCFTPDGFWVVEEYLAGRSAASVDALRQAVRSGSILVPAVHASIFTGSATLEGLVRTLFPSHRFAREQGTAFDVALVTDVPSCSWSFASVLAAAGVKYLAVASDAYRGPFLLRNRLNERSPHRWEGPDGGQVVTWQSRHYHQASSLFGMPPRVSLGRDSLPRFLQAYDRPEYRSDGVILYGSQVENVTLQPEQASFAGQWNAVYAYPRLRYSGFAEALEAIVRQQGELPVVRGDGGPYWEDGLAANARATALARGNSRRILSAEKIATLASLANPRFKPDEKEFAEAWKHSRLMDEHTWHADCSVRDPQSDQARRQGEAKEAHAVDARRALDRALRRGMSALADSIPAGPGSMVLFNPSSWPRRDLLEVEFGRDRSLVDATSGEAVAFEVLRTGRVYQRVRLMTPEIPALGYRCLQLRPMLVAPQPVPSQTPRVIESPFYRVELAPERGGIRSIVDKSSGQELVSTNAEYAFGQLLYVSGGDELPNRIVQYSTVSPMPALSVLGTTDGALKQSTVTAIGATAQLVSHTRNFPEVETEIVLPTNRREIRLTVRGRKIATLAKEAVYVAFPFSMNEPRFRYATQNGFVDPARDLLRGACQEWFSIQDWVAVEGSTGTVMLAPLDAPLVTLGDIVRGAWPEEFGSRPANVFSYVMSNYTPEGYAAEQGGEFSFRYVLTSASRFDPAVASRFGAEALTPLEVNEITRSDKLGVSTGLLDAAQGDCLRVHPAEVHVVTWKPAEDGRGSVVRLLETSGKRTMVSLSLACAELMGGHLCNVVEDDQAPIEVRDGVLRAPIVPFGILSIRLQADHVAR